MGRKGSIQSRVSIRSIAVLVSISALVVVGFDEPAHAEPASQTPDAKPAPEPTFKEQVQEVWNRDLFLGDWQGLRTQLHDHGIDVGLRLAMYGQGVTSGGVG